MRTDQQARLVGEILNAGYMVRHYSRGARMRETSPLAAQRRAAIAQFCGVARDALATTSTGGDCEVILKAIVDALVPNDEPRF